MPHDALKQLTHKINLALVDAGLVKLTWGNASVVDRTHNIMAIKPSGVPYPLLTPDDIVLLNLSTGKKIEGAKNPSSDTPTHLHLYQHFPNLGAIVHTHSDFATSFAQALADIPCLGTTHADHFYGTVPCTRSMTPEEIQSDYELNTGKLIVETFNTRNLNPDETPGVLVASHAPFAWGTTAQKALENAIVLEYIAKMQLQAYALNPNIKPIAPALLNKHFHRKHGPGATYGQSK